MDEMFITDRLATFAAASSDPLATHVFALAGDVSAVSSSAADRFFQAGCCLRVLQLSGISDNFMPNTAAGFVDEKYYSS
jgi:hypothetical protein